MNRNFKLLAGIVAALGFSLPHAAQSVVLDFDTAVHATSGFEVLQTGGIYSEDGFQIAMFDGSNLGNWGTSSGNYLDSPTLFAGSSATWLELTHANGNLFAVESIDVLDFFAADASDNALSNHQVTFYATKADNTVLSSTFTFSTLSYDREVHSFGAEFTGLTHFAWNQNAWGVPVAGATANRSHQIDNLVVKSLGTLPPTIVAFGDSTTAPRNVGASLNGRPNGYTTSGINSSDASNAPHNAVNTVTDSSTNLYVYADQLRDQLNASGFAFQAIDNEGIGGNQTSQALARFESDVVVKDPDIVIIQFGINDSWIDNASVAETAGFDPANGNDGNSRVDVSTYRNNLDAMVQSLTSDGVSVILMSPNLQGSLYEMAGSLNPDFRNARLEQFVFAMEDVYAEAIGEGRDVQYIDVWQMYIDHIASGGDADDWLLDSQHPNALGHAMIAEELASIISVPEPSSLVFLSLAGLVLVRRRNHVCLPSLHPNME